MGFEPTAICNLAGRSNHWGGFKLFQVGVISTFKISLILTLKNIIIIYHYIFFAVKITFEDAL